MGLTGTLGYSGVGIEKVSKLKVVIVICNPASVNHKQNQTKPRSESLCLALGTHEHAVMAKQAQVQSQSCEVTRISKSPLPTGSSRFLLLNLGMIFRKSELTKIIQYLNSC
jgi:hypothetical protein